MYRIRMNQDSKQVLWENVSALMKREFGKENLTALAKRAKIGPGTATRIKEQTTSVGIDVLDQIAVAFRVKPWHLLMPKRDSSSPAKESLAGTEWPLDKVDRAAYEALPLDERIFVQGHLDRLIAERTEAQERGGNTKSAS